MINFVLIGGEDKEKEISETEEGQEKEKRTQRIFLTICQKMKKIFVFCN